MNKAHLFTVFIALIIFSSDAFACFSGEAYRENWESTQLLIGVALLLSVLSLVLRYLSHKARFWVPLLALAIYMYLPVVTGLGSMVFQSGDCGEGLLTSSYWAIAGAFVVLFYEIFHYLKSRA